jgi:tetratricopeptide (TPR) repeat protein
MKFNALSLFVLCGFCLGLLGQAQGLFAEADSTAADLTLLNRQYAEALSLPETEQSTALHTIAQQYQKILDRQSSPSAFLYYNCGTLYLKIQNYGQAIYCLKKAYKLNPNDQRIVDHLHRALMQAKVQMPPQDDMSLALWGQRFWSALTVMQWQVMLFAFSLGCAVFFVFRGKSKPRAFIFLTSIGLVLMGVALARDQNIGIQKEVILFSAQNPRSGLGPQYPGILSDSTNLPAGSSGKLLREESGWYEVNWNGHSRGWIPKNTAGLVF